MTTHSTNSNNETLNTQPPLTIAIIGAGLTGLITADLLEQSFQYQNKPVHITIFEKSAGVGRLATRYKRPESSTHNNSHIDITRQWQFDFGAQFFTAKTPAFQSYLQPWIDDSIIQPWRANVASVTKSVSTSGSEYDIQKAGQWHLDQPRYISQPKMTTWGRAIAQKLTQTTLNYKTRVAPLNDSSLQTSDKNVRDPDLNMTALKTTNLGTANPQTLLFDDAGNELGNFDWVICTAPQSQAIELFANTHFAHARAITQPTMLACYTLMLGWADSADLPTHLTQANWSVLTIDAQDEILPQPLSCLGKVFIEHKKPGRDHILPSVTIHANNRWSQAHVDADIETVQAQLLAASKTLLQWNEATAPVHIDCHRWRYAATVTTQSDQSDPLIQIGSKTLAKSSAYCDTTKQWIVAGDWCDEGRIESCFITARQVVTEVV